MDTLIFLGLIALPFINWPVAIMLIRLARIRPTIRALTERAILAVLIAILTTIYVVLAINTEAGFPLISSEMVVLLLRAMMLTFGLFPLWWLWSYYQGRFQGGLDDEAEESVKRDGDIDAA